jgi:MFS family permease
MVEQGAVQYAVIGQKQDEGFRNAPAPTVIEAPITGPAWGRRAIQTTTMFVVMLLSLLLLLYVSHGDARRTYEQLHIEKQISDGLVVQMAIENFLRDGLSLKQFAGFSTLAAPMLADDLDAMTVYDQAGHQVFQVIDQVNPPKLPDPSETIKNNAREIKIDYTPTHYQIVMPLRTRFEIVGSLVLHNPIKAVTKRISEAFYWLPYAALGLSLVFSVIMLFWLPYFDKSRLPWLQIGYGATFLVLAIAVIGTLGSLYYSGVEGKSKSAAVTLSQRLHDIVAFKLEFKDIDGLGELFSEFRQANPEIKDIALFENGRIVIDPARHDKGVVSDSRDFEYEIPVSTEDAKRIVALVMSVPRNVLYERVLRSIKNFAALFVASAFLAVLFFHVATAFQDIARGSPNHARVAASDAGLVMIKPVFFLAVFLDSLTYSFLPKYMNEAAIAAGFSASYASVPFTSYYLCFALSLLPAGNLVERYGPKPIILTGMLLAGASVAAMFLPLGIHGLTVLRGLAGVGQGILMIGVQSYILLVAPPEKKTQGAAIIVFGFQGGMLSGTALGSLLVNQLQPKGVFAVAGGVAFIAILYAALLVPRVIPVEKVSIGFLLVARKLANDIRSVVTNLQFLKVMLCIGVPAKAILTGTIAFAMPLLLGQYGYRSEEIGQIVMLYGLGVIVSTGYVSRFVDRTRNSEGVLVMGAVASGIGLVMVGLMGSPYLGNGPLSTVVVLAGTILVGLAHGLINAPVVTHVAHLELANRVGVNPVTTSYRFLERSGHVAGPFIVAQLFMLLGQDARIIAWIGIAIIILGLLFMISRFIPGVNAAPAEAAP